MQRHCLTRFRTELKWTSTHQFRTSLSFVHNASRQHIRPVRLCYGLRGIYGRFDSKIRFENESDGRFDSRFDSNEKKRFAGPYSKRQLKMRFKPPRELTFARRSAVTHRTSVASSSQHKYLTHFGLFLCTNAGWNVWTFAFSVRTF